MVDLVAMISLYELHSWVITVRFGAIMGGWMNLWSLDCSEFIHELYVVRIFLMNLWSINRLCFEVIVMVKK